MAELLEVSYEHLSYILYRAKHKYPYRTFQVKKRKGGHRTISVPHPTIKILQEKLNEVLRLVYKPRVSTHGFALDRNIITNAERHVRKNFVLNVDLADFFPSIHFGRIRGMFIAEPYGLPPEAATVLAQLCCHQKALPQGAPTSPIVSNMICSRMDGELQRLASGYRCVYTRYADDITISCTQGEFPRDLALAEVIGGRKSVMVGSGLGAVIKANGFSVNDVKTRLQFRTERQSVTGLTVNSYPNVPRRALSQIRAMLHALEKFGLEEAEKEFRLKWDRPSRRPGNKKVSFKQVLKGKLAFVGMVKGSGDRRYRRLRNALHAIDPELVSRIPDPPQLNVGGPWSVWCLKYRRLVFQLEITLTNGSVAGGTAFAWKDDWLATAAHNAGTGVQGVAVYHQGNDKAPAAIVRTVFHPQADGGAGVDAAVLSLPPGLLKFPAAFPIRKDPVNPGEEVAALGFPNIPGHHSEFSILPGVVESVANKFDRKSQTIQVSADISGGVSGGPVIDRLGRLIGIVMEASTERATDEVPGRKFRHVLPVSYLLAIAADRNLKSMEE